MQLLLPCCIWTLADVIWLTMGVTSSQVSIITVSWNYNVCINLCRLYVIQCRDFIYNSILVPVSAGLQTLKVLNLGFNEISDAILVHLKGKVVKAFILIVLGNKMFLKSLLAHVCVYARIWCRTSVR